MRSTDTDTNERPNYCPICGTYTGGQRCPREATPRDLVSELRTMGVL